MEVIHLYSVYLFLKTAHELIKKIKGLFSVTLLSECKGLNFSRVEGVSRALLQIHACNYYDYVCAPFNIFIKIFFYSHCLSFIFHVEEIPFSFSACVETGNDGKYVAGKSEQLKECSVVRGKTIINASRVFNSKQHCFSCIITQHLVGMVRGPGATEEGVRGNPSTLGF